MKKAATALLWATLAAALPVLSIADQNQDRQQMDLTADPCASLLPDNPKGYQDCKDGQLEAIGLTCTIYTFNPIAGSIKKFTFKAALGATCPDDRYTEALAAQVRHDREKRERQWRIQSCVGSGQIWDPVSQSCFRCPVGQMRWQNGTSVYCVPTTCPLGHVRGQTTGQCVAPPPINPLPGPTQPINPPCADNPGCRQH